MACTWFGEIPSCCSLTALPGPAWVQLNYVLQTIFSGPVHTVIKVLGNSSHLADAVVVTGGGVCVVGSSSKTGSAVVGSSVTGFIVVGR